MAKEFALEFIQCTKFTLDCNALSTFGMQSLQGTASALPTGAQANSMAALRRSVVPLDQIDWSLDDSIPNIDDNDKEQSRKPS
jgi:hypothetical protein